MTAQSLCRGYEDPHFVPAKPSLMKAIQHADVFVSTGLELDGGWLPLVLPGSRNPKIQQGTKGFVDASAKRQRAREAGGHGQPGRG